MFTLTDLAVALNRAITPEEEQYYQYLIDSVTAYIEGETGVAFSLHTNETLRYRADGMGVVELIGPVVEIINVSPVYTSGYWDYDAGGYHYSGLDELYGLYPYETVDVTYTYGYDLTEVPEDIKTVAIDAVVHKITGNSPDELREKTVGDITYKWAVSETDFDSFGLRVLNAYRGVGKTWRL